MEDGGRCTSPQSQRTALHTAPEAASGQVKNPRVLERLDGSPADDARELATRGRHHNNFFRLLCRSLAVTDGRLTPAAD